jgi:ribonuclease BN (tRNA processing enzyme)
MFKKVKIKILSTEPTINSIKELVTSVGADEFLDSAEFFSLPLEGTSKIGEIILTTVKAIHPVPAVSLVLKINNHKISYSGDTALNVGFLKASRRSDLLIHELSAPRELSDKARKYGHTSEADLKTIIETACPRYFLPTHYYIHPPLMELENLKHCSTKLLTPASCACYEL